MATNVTERNKTLNEIIEWCETRISTINVDYTETAADVLVFLGERQALGDVADHCRSMLGYSGSMPSEVPNQGRWPIHEKRGREMNKRYKVCPLFWSDYGCKRTLMNMGAFEELLNEGWQILRVDTMPPTELRDNAVAATNVYILEREANDD